MNTKLLSMLMHDIKQPVDVIDATYDCLYRFADREEAVKIIDIGKENSKYLRRIVNNICDIARNEGKVLEINCISMDVKEYADMYAEKLTPYLEENNVNFLVKSNGADFICDFDIVSKILNDIVSNAVKYNDKEQKVVKLTLAVENDNLTIEVSDNGMGIPEDEVAHVTELMFRASNAKRSVTSGSGLGLNLVAGLVESMNGHMNIKSKVGVGTSVTITLPAGKVTALAGNNVVFKSLEKETLDLLFSNYTDIM